MESIGRKSVEVARIHSFVQKIQGFIRRFYKNGMIVKSDFLVSESHVSLSESVVAEANKQVETITSYLQRLLDIDEPLTIVWSALS